MGVEVRLPKFRASYVAVETPKPVGASKKLKYSVMALFDKDADLSALRAAFIAALKEKFGDKAAAVAKHPKFKTPMKDQAELIDEDGEQRPGTVPGAWFLNLSHDMKPLVLGLDAKELKDPRDFYSGCYAVAKCEVFAWDHPEGGRGVTFGLLGIQKVAEGERLGGGGLRAAPSDFEAVKGAASGSTASSVFGGDLDDEIPF